MYPSNDSTLTTASSACSTSRPSSASSAPPIEFSKSLPAGAPSTPFFEIHDTPTAGRAVFATRSIAEGTLLWRSDDLTLSVLLREYRREVCGQCFSYDYGRDLPIRDQSVGFAFCSKECQEVWKQWNGDVGVRAWIAVETLVKKRSKEDDEMVEANLPRPTGKEIGSAWGGVEAQASLILTAREAERPMSEGLADETKDGPVQITKQHRKALQRALQQKISPDVMSFIVSGIVWRHNSPQDWDKVLVLADDTTPYHSADDLAAFVRSYLHLLAILPLPLLPLTTPETIFLLSSRDSHNSFGIRSLEDDGSEFFGYGCWPAASYFNHSCGPNIEKNREGRVWNFRAGSDIEAGEELNITYLSGEERKLSRGERMQTLKRNWGFECSCRRCGAVGG
ncbi:SET domain-containing protein [Macroventuria anomochaeta]|uniref:SET domain-containing protein n=1 Tax=Macroventuria anomochaeta TaxID=301207 RepID=A0ACB6RIH1_9PLEO|nr:SET domain-containing protein [Macroventuria anomochaeta]KAF2621559.1 SET domain-containing protein [Macroventuria anomochaeta]